MKLDRSLRPVIDADSDYYWRSLREKKFRLQECSHCGVIRAFAAPVCASCSSEKFTWRDMGGKGTIYSFTEVHHSVFPGFKDELPFVIAWVELTEQKALRVPSVIEHADAPVKIGDAVELFFLEVDDDLTLPRFRLIGKA